MHRYKVGFIQPSYSQPRVFTILQLITLADGIPCDELPGTDD